MKKQLLEGASGFSAKGKKTQGKDESAGQGSELFPADGSSRWNWSGLKKSHSCSDARELRKLVDHDQREITISRKCELLGLYPDPRCTTSPSLCLNPPWGSWPGSMRCIWRIQPLEAVGMVQYLPEKGSRSAVDRSETSMRCMGFTGASTRSHAPRCQVDPSERFPAWWTSKEVNGSGISWAQILPISHYGRASSTWWPLVDLFSRNVSQLKLSKQP